MTSPDALTRTYLRFFEHTLGIPAEVDDDKDVAIEFGGLHMYVMNTAPHDPACFRLILLVRADHPYAELQRIAMMATADATFVRVLPRSDGLALCIDMLVGADGCLPSVQQLAAIVPRCLRTMAAAARDVFEHLEFLDATRGIEIDAESVEAEVAREASTAD
jgi:hypothetical protein